MARKEFDSLDIKPFVRTLSYREFLTSITSVIVIFAIGSILQYLSIFTPLSFLLVFLLVAMICNHIVYNIEHRRSNRYIGRLFHDLITIVIFIMVSFIIQYTNSMNIEEASVYFIASFLIVTFLIIFEIIVGLLKRLLIHFRWPIL